MYKLISESPLCYSIDGVEQNTQAHNHQVCPEGCDVPFNIDYIIDGGEKKAVGYPEDKFCCDCSCWQGE